MSTRKKKTARPARYPSQSSYARALRKQHPDWTIARIALKSGLHRVTVIEALAAKTDRRGRPPAKRKSVKR
jgi:hypothetical protein